MGTLARPSQEGQSAKSGSAAGALPQMKEANRMFARSTTIHGDSANVEAAIAYVSDEIMPTLSDMDGCVGLSMMVDRDTGRCIATTSWETEEEMKASMSRLTEARTRVGELLGGTPEVTEWEVAVMHREHRAHEGSCCRVTWGDIDPAGMDGVVGWYRDTALPTLEAMAGFCSASLFIDRMSGRLCSTARFESREDMTASRDEARTLRDSGSTETGFHVTDIAEFDLAIAHLRVPELV